MSKELDVNRIKNILIYGNVWNWRNKKLRPKRYLKKK